MPTPMRLARLTTTLATCTASALLLTGIDSAHAASGYTERVSDPRGDAPARADVTRVVATAATDSFEITIRVRNLTKRGKFVLGTGVGGWGYDWTVTRTKHRTTVRLTQLAETHTDDLGTCRPARVRWNARKNVIRATLPYSCTGSAGDYAPWGGIVFRSAGARDNVGEYWPGYPH